MKLSEPDRIRVRHMIEAAESAVEFSAGREHAELYTDKMLLFAVARAIEIVGEAASKVSTDGRALMPALPWKSMVGMRNRLVHAYFDIDANVVWKTVSEELPPLLAQLQAVEQQQADSNQNERPNAA